MEEQWVIDLRNFVCDEPDSSEIIEERNPFAGRTHTEETKKQMSSSAKNRPPVSEETRRKNAKFGEANGFYGKTHSEESRKKMSLSAKGNTSALGSIRTEEMKAKYRVAKIGSRWYNNGKITKQFLEFPGEGWTPGRKINNHIENNKD